MLAYGDSQINMKRYNLWSYEGPVHDPFCVSTSNSLCQHYI